MAETRQTENTSKGKELFVNAATILGFIVDVIALLSLLPIGVNVSGKLEILKPQNSLVIFELSKFSISWRDFTGIIGLCILVISFFAMSYYLEREKNSNRLLTVYLIYCQSVWGLPLLWCLTFYPPANLTIYFMFFTGCLAPILMVLGFSLAEWLNCSSIFVALFIGAISWIVAAFLEIGFTGVTMFSALGLSLIAVIIGVVILIIFYNIFGKIFSFASVLHINS